MLHSLTAPCERQIDTGLVFDALMNAEGCACYLFRHSCSSLVMRPSIPSARSRDQNPRMLCDICPCHFHQKAGPHYWYFGCFLQFISFSLYKWSWIGVELSFIGDLGRDIDQIYVFSTEGVLCPTVSSRRESSEYLSRIAQVKPCTKWPLTFPFASLSFEPSLCMGISGLPWWHRRGVWGHLTLWPVPGFRGAGYQEGLSHKIDGPSLYLNYYLKFLKENSHCRCRNMTLHQYLGHNNI